MAIRGICALTVRHRSPAPWHKMLQDFASDFKADLYNNAEDWAALFKENGVQMAVLTSKHHDGFELWPSPNAYSWNSVDIGPKQDLVAAFLKSMRDAGVHAGLYHSVFEWFNPLYRGPNPQSYVDQKLIPDLTTLVNDYTPDMLLMDGEWEVRHPTTAPGPGGHWFAAEAVPAR
jgi:alpha-L-fucosidase